MVEKAPTIDGLIATLAEFLLEVIVIAGLPVRSVMASTDSSFLVTGLRMRPKRITAQMDAAIPTARCSFRFFNILF